LAMRQCVRPPLVYAPQVFLRRQDRQSELNRRQICFDIRDGPASNVRLSCTPEQGEGHLNFLLAGGFSGNPLVNRSQFVGCRLVSGVGEFCFYFKRKLGQLVLLSSGQRALMVEKPILMSFAQ